MMNFNALRLLADYQTATARFAAYPADVAHLYSRVALIEEIGEFAGVQAKALRAGEEIPRDRELDELGDIAWQLCDLMRACGVVPTEIAPNTVRDNRALEELAIAAANLLRQHDRRVDLVTHLEVAVGAFLNLAGPDLPEILAGNVAKLEKREREGTIADVDRPPDCHACGAVVRDHGVSYADGTGRVWHPECDPDEAGPETRVDGAVVDVDDPPRPPTQTLGLGTPSLQAEPQKLGAPPTPIIEEGARAGLLERVDEVLLGPDGTPGPIDRDKLGDVAGLVAREIPARYRPLVVAKLRGDDQVRIERAASLHFSDEPLDPDASNFRPAPAIELYFIVR